MAVDIAVQAAQTGEYSGPAAALARAALFEQQRREAKADNITAAQPT